MQKLRLFGMNGLFALMLACTAGTSRAQQPGYLILIDAANEQPFTARIGENLMQSSVHGHLLISRLEDSSYRVIIGFPRESIPEQIFPITIQKKDHGYQLRETDSSWELYNWQSREIIHPLKEPDSSRLLDQGVKREDRFSRLMAAVVNDSSVMYNTFARNNPPKDSLSGKRETGAMLSAENEAGTAGPDSALAAADSKKPEPGLLKAKSRPSSGVMMEKSTVRKLREVSLKISRKMVFQDISPDGEKDTITLFVYFEKAGSSVKKRPEDPMVTALRLLRNDTAETKADRQAKEVTAVAARPQDKASGKDSVKEGQETTKPEPAPSVGRQGGSCGQQAADSDAEALRDEILVRNTEDEKISVAAGAFIMKCFSVDQLRALAGLFVSEKAKYRLLDAACLHVWDADHFSDLADLFTEKAYRKKFRVLLEKRK